MILPVIELRISSFAGHKKLNKINYHVIFSDQLSVDAIEAFFLNGLGIEFELDDGKFWRGRVSSKELLAKFGQAIIDSTPISKKPNKSPLNVGFDNAVFSLDKVRDIVNETEFQGKVLTAIGISEWDDMRFESATGPKRDIINQADLVFVASPSPESYSQRKKQLQEQEVNSRLLDCSDAHHYADSSQPMRLGNTFSWLKADLTFQGLRRVVKCFDDRVEIKSLGDVPNQLKRIRENRTKYIRSIEIRKKPDSTFSEEHWFDCKVPLNPGMVAIIGNQGNGKSALTDIIALCGNTKTTGFSFLTKDKFKDGQNKAGEFIATLMWEDSSESPPKGLDETIKETDYERVRYVPQGFFDAVTNETVVQKGGKFYGEIEKAVFSHIEKSERLGCNTIDELIKNKTTQINQGLASLRQELTQLNEQIIELEVACSPKEITRIENEIKAKENEISAHKENPPKPVDEPDKSTKVNQEIEQLREKEGALEVKITQKQDELGALNQTNEFLTQKKTAINEKFRQLQVFIDSLQNEFDNRNFNLTASKMISVQVNTAEIDKLLADFTTKILETKQQINPDFEDSLVSQLQKSKDQRKDLEKSIKKTNQAYQTYRTAYVEWETRLEKLIGNKNSTGSLEWLKQELATKQEFKPRELQKLQTLRKEKAIEIHKRLQQVSKIYQDLTLPVQKHIESEPLTRDKYKMRFAIDLVEHSLGDKLFSLIKRSGSHSFTGIPEGDDKLKELIDKFDFDSEDETAEFVQELHLRLAQNHNYDPPRPIEIENIFRKDKNLHNMYDLLYGLEYLTPEYSITLNGKPLKQLSPGERGILLLVFYLVIDKGDNPLIIDQPEGNLNNQSIFNNLVPVFKKAKNRRQIIIVTHNPNLAVVSDAEQIIHAKIDFEDGNRVRFDGGALENPQFNRLSLDVLEGTPPAFHARKSTYEVE